MEELFTNNNTGAQFSECGKHRFCLWRIWDEDLPAVCFIGLNPSTANQKENDPTIRRVISFAKKWGYGRVYMLNLFSFVTPFPEELKKNEFTKFYFENREMIKDITAVCDKIIFAWGNFKEAVEMANEVSINYPGAYCLKKNKNGSPIHPLYVKSDTIPVRFKDLIKGITEP